jgi:MioC protein
MPIIILFGTETGTAEMVAYDLADRLGDIDEASVYDMAEYEVSDLVADNFYVIVCSTHEDGELPESAQPFFDRLHSESPELAGLRYGMFGMGDSTYSETYNFGSETIDNRFTELGATRVGEYGRHDASSRESASDAGLAWIEKILPLI